MLPSVEGCIEQISIMPGKRFVNADREPECNQCGRRRPHGTNNDIRNKENKVHKGGVIWGEDSSHI